MNNTMFSTKMMSVNTRLILLMLAWLLMTGLGAGPPFEGGGRRAEGGLMLSSEIQNQHVQNSKSETDVPGIRDSKSKGSQSAIRPPPSAEERQQRARQYSRGWYWFYFINQGYTFLILFLILATGLSARLRRWAERITHSMAGGGRRMADWISIPKSKIQNRYGGAGESF